MNPAEMVPGVRYGTRLKDGVVRFIFDGRTYEGRQGDTAASALLANGVVWFGRSVKSRRLRGVMTAGPEEPCALLTVGEYPNVVPNVPATECLLHDGMVLRSQNRWPSLAFDFASLLQWGGGLFTAGFYYKTFFLPGWRAFEPLIRRLAGLGLAPGPEAADGAANRPPQEEHVTCDLLVVGAGPAGLAAARVAARNGLQVVVVEREPAIGGETEFEESVIDSQAAHHWLKAAISSAAARVRPGSRNPRRVPRPEPGGVRVLLQTSAVALASDSVVAYREGIEATNFRIHARQVLNAVGAQEQPLVFVGNDLPGVQMLGGAERFAALYGWVPKGPVVLFGNHDRLYASALRLRGQGARVVAIVDTRSFNVSSSHVRDDPAADEWRRAACSLLEAVGVECLTGSTVRVACGGRRLRSVEVVAIAGTAHTREIRCESLLMSGGWLPRRALPMGTTVGAAAGCLDLAAAVASGHAGGVAVLQQTGLLAAVAEISATPLATGDPSPRVEPYLRSPCATHEEKRQYIDLQNDVTVADLRVAIAEGFTDIEHAKRYTTLGIGTDQGRWGGHVGAAILADLQGLPPATASTSKARPPLASVSLQAIAGWRVGDSFRLVRRTPLHDWHVAHGGNPEPMGLWFRPRFYAANGQDAATAAVVEAGRVRQIGGIADCSTLGKLEIAGPDAAKFLDEIYLTRPSTLAVGRSRYAVQLREDGMVLDDGLVLRLAEDRFLATTSSGHGLHVLSHLEHHRAHRAPLRVSVADVTDCWAVIAVAGRASADALRALLGRDPQELSPMAFWDWSGPLQGVGVAGQGGQRLRVLRAGFSGELSFELHCSPALALPLWEALQAAGLMPYGLDALDILRVEKGYLTTSEINGQVTPLDLGMEAMVAKAGPCIGLELLQRPAFHEPHRPRLVGLRALDGRSSFLAGSQLTVGPKDRVPMGYVTSSVFGAASGETVALALAARDVAPLGTVLWARDPLRGRDVQVRVVAPVHFDPLGERLRGRY